ncbi:basic phospholipase A2 notechis 11'2 [Schistocerca gregaria]|uniref:basic phospholipase A2 notechis 11'2 n=1 Tax=Schistocerca gregaria TaxID=7010 RepID=UPI00211DECF7|nr:basic phospholipase A2 notechis 11'2 [Schistocerca gregaria]
MPLCWVGLAAVLVLSQGCSGGAGGNATGPVYLARGGRPWLPSVALTLEGQQQQGGDSGGSYRRPRRGVFNLYSMVQCATGCDPLRYKGYGCYCGFLGSGYPVDPIDKCCKMHDWCYNVADCPVFLEYFVPYYWQCFYTTPICALEHGYWGRCAQRLCDCDRRLAECLRNFPCPRGKAVCTSSTFRYLQNVILG